jgi:hypothetical protein
MNVTFSLRNVLILFTLGLSLVVPSALAQDKKINDDSLAQVNVASDLITLNTASGFAGFTLKVKGPNGTFFEQNFTGSEVPFVEAFDLNGNMLADGPYTFELVGIPQLNDDNHWAMEKVREDSELTSELRDLLPADRAVQTGYFRIVQGAFVLPETEATFAPRVSENVVLSKDEVKDGGSSPIDLDGGNRDQVFADDLIVQGSACVGMDCANGESFGFDTIRLKENNLRIKFQDTSNSGSFPSVDWQLTANDTSNGGANKFSIDDIDSGKTPFTIEHSAPSGSLYVDDAGNIGVGTSTPVVEVHVVDGDSPTLRLQQDASSGFTPQIWDVAGNETNFFVRDATNGSKIPFKIKPSAPVNSLFIDSDGDIGMGTQSPDSAIHFVRNSASAAASLHLQNTNAAGAASIFIDSNDNSTTQLRISAPDGGTGIRTSYEQTGTGGDTWFQTMNGNGMAFQKSGDEVAYFIRTNGGNGHIHLWGNGSDNTVSAPRMKLDTNGDLTITGTLATGSDRNIKEDIASVDPREVLATVAEMPISSWKYIADESGIRHMGPMAQDFYAAFGLGADNRHIATVDSDGVALAAIKGLNEIVTEKNAEIDDLKARLAKLEAMMQKLAD